MPAVKYPMAQSSASFSYAFPRIKSLLMNPANGKIPAMASAAMSMVQYVMGIFFESAPIFRMSCSPETAWITLPAARKSKPLKNACVIKWKIPAVNAPTPQAKNM